MKISLKFVSKSPINNIPSLILTGAKQLSELMMAYFTAAYMCHSVSLS